MSFGFRMRLKAIGSLVSEEKDAFPDPIVSELKAPLKEKYFIVRLPPGDDGISAEASKTHEFSVRPKLLKERESTLLSRWRVTGLPFAVFSKVAVPTIEAERVEWEGGRFDHG